MHYTPIVARVGHPNRYMKAIPMSLNFEELDYQETPIGALSLRRRRSVATGEDIYEIKLDDDFLMSSQFTASEIALADLGIQSCPGDALDVVVGGLGLGYTARTVLGHDTVASVIVVDALSAVITWHQCGLLPLGQDLTSDPRCRFVCGNFFDLAASESGFDPDAPARTYDAILVDIDHSPANLLNADNAPFYQQEGLIQLRTHLKPGGAFGLWSNDPPDETFTARLASVFASAKSEPVVFDNPLQNTDVTQTVYLAWA